MFDAEVDASSACSRKRKRASVSIRSIRWQSCSGVSVDLALALPIEHPGVETLKLFEDKFLLATPSAVAADADPFDFSECNTSDGEFDSEVNGNTLTLSTETEFPVAEGCTQMFTSTLSRRPPPAIPSGPKRR